MKYSDSRRLQKVHPELELPQNTPGVSDIFDEVVKYYSQGQINLITVGIEFNDDRFLTMWGGDDLLLKRVGLAECMKQDICSPIYQEGDES